MRKTDDAEAMRLLAHQLWERDGRPSGREHEHWAEAARLLASAEEVEVEVHDDGPVEEPEQSEATRLRRALYAPEAYSMDPEEADHTYVAPGQDKQGR